MSQMLAWAQAHQEWLWWLGAASLVMFLLTPLLVLLLALRIPQDYFVDPRRHRSGLRRRFPVYWLALEVVKNLAGAILVLAGLAMLLLPGQGILTILLGLVLLEFPGKYALERRLAVRPGVLRAINWMRRRGRRPPLLPPDGGVDGTGTKR